MNAIFDIYLLVMMILNSTRPFCSVNFPKGSELISDIVELRIARKECDGGKDGEYDS